MVRESNGGARPAQYTMQFKRLAAISLILSPQELSKILLARSRVAVAKVDELTEIRRLKYQITYQPPFPIPGPNPTQEYANGFWHVIRVASCEFAQVLGGFDSHDLDFAQHRLRAFVRFQQRQCVIYAFQTLDVGIEVIHKNEIEYTRQDCPNSDMGQLWPGFHPVLDLESR
jgi:hypothetical protein